VPGAPASPAQNLYGLGTSVYAQRDGKILILKRAGGVATGAWYTPGGVLDPGETPEQCAVRELHEEAGLRPTSPLALVGLIPAYVYGHDSFLVAYACDCDEGEVSISHEHEAWRWIDARDFRDRFFSEDNVAKVAAADERLGKLAAAIQKGMDDYLAWRSRQDEWLRMTGGA
jgi:8-oxo-dGTP diphosphatase